ncbi:S8 family serine peptidase [Engelhardtia mirabilis]|uniref:Extracellular serine proteinase n=1 Tax=Engelhardtia mirabilis TaxID=2528011 RepID=A0A518BNF5_9BACT|nr:Extracellular serine proteinase precursor [Planctomycetes bacterium Pla133]QDV02839.1 Extracellular serine proteinase precursor [Planctomycetes bacterium Pla86]
MRAKNIVAAALALGAPALAQSGQVTPYGCGTNPAGSLKVTAGAPAVGQSFELTALDAAGSLPPGSVASILLSGAPLALPCGVSLPGFGPGDTAGALLIGLGGNILASSGPLPMVGGDAAVYPFAVPGNPALAGFKVYAQALMFDPAGSDQYLSEALAITLGGTAQPNLTLRSVSTSDHVIAPGESTVLHVVVRNEGGAPSAPTTVEVCNAAGKCVSGDVPALPAGTSLVLNLSVGWNLFEPSNNPNFFTAVIDPDGKVAESDESDNAHTAVKPLMVVEPILVSPVVEIDHDEVLTIENGVLTSYQRKDYPQGAPVELDVPVDPNKGGTNPANGLMEALGQGPAPAPKVDPKLQQLEQALEQGQQIDYVVKYRHQVPMPRLPDLTAELERFGPDNMAAFELRAAMFEGVRRARRNAAAELVQTIQGQFGAQVLEHYALCGSMLVRAPKGLLQFLNQSDDVLHVERVLEDESTPPDSVADGRDLIDTDAYFNGGATGVNYTALLDSGIRSSHTLFTGPDHIYFEEDCVYGNSSCADTGNASYDPDDDFWDHGTSTAAILTGNSDLGNDSRGVTAGWVDSWKVYNSAGLNTTAVLRGFDEAVYWGDKVIVCEIQSTQSETGSIADAADDAFEAGCCVIAANGNYGPGLGTVASPANAHKAIGVGAYDVDSLVNESYVSQGPTGDDRYKPDLQAPTNTDTASNISSTTINNFGGTSGATPYAAGAASIFADWFGLGALTEVAAGKVYAGLLVGGTREWDTPFNNTEGVGRFALPLNGTLYTGSRTLSNGDNAYVTINVPSTADTVEVAIWWAEKPGWTHRDMDVYIQRPDGTTSDSSLSVPSVFERVKVNNASSGNRDIRIHAYSVPWLKNQTVYYAIHVH